MRPCTPHRKLKLSGIDESVCSRIGDGVAEYCAAFLDCSRLLEDGELIVGDLGKYERFLIEELEIQFDRIAEEQGEEFAQQVRRGATDEIYSWSLSVGCPPEFVRRLQLLLEQA